MTIPIEMNESASLAFSLIIIIILLFFVSFVSFRRKDKVSLNHDLKNKTNKNSYKIAKKSDFLYKIYLFNNNSEIVFESNLVETKMRSRHLLRLINKVIENDKYIIDIKTDSSYELIYLNSKNYCLGVSKRVNKKEEIESLVSELKELSKTVSLKLDVIEGTEIKEFTVDNSIKNKKSLRKEEIIDDSKYIIIKKDDTILFRSNNSINFNRMKYELDKAINLRTFYIDRDPYKKFTVIIYSKTYGLIYDSIKFDSVAQAISHINNIISYY